MGNLVLGIDDSGRGPLIGPMILAGVLMVKDKDGLFKDHGVKDSKMLPHKKRIELLKVIGEHSIDSFIVKSTPEEIDGSIHSGINLNTLEAIKTAMIINKLNTKERQKEKIKVIVDCPSVNIFAWTNTLRKYIEYTDNLDVVCEHKADVNHPVVSAASILAKVAREDEMDKIKKQYKELENMGSGYSHDPMTKEFVKKHGKKLADSGIFRKSWATWKDLFPEDGQATLGKF
jgi:ribonuclease HII